MLFFKLLLFGGLFIVFYSYLGYGILVCILLFLKKIFVRRDAALPDGDPHIVQDPGELPALTLIVAAYNEEAFIEEKIRNTLGLDYPKEKLDILFVTDGSSDATPRLAAAFEGIRVLHQPERKGKIAAIHRAMAHVGTPIVVFSDANTLLNKESVRRIARHYQSSDVGGVAGEKKVMMTDSAKVAGVGEGLYWKYESFLKKLDARLYTVVGAAGELFSIRTELYEYPGDHVLLDDFVISLRICRRGYRVLYEPDAYALEAPSASLREEQKRKLRISAGAFQSMVMLKDLLNIFKYPMLSFQYISHRVLRWTLCPAFLPLLLISNTVLVMKGSGPVYLILLAAQILFYLAALTGWVMARQNKKVKMLYVPYYFLFLNVSLYQGFIRYRKGRQSVLWEKATRENYIGS